MPLSQQTDLALLQAIRQNDKAAFAELFKRYWKKAHAMALARVCSDEVTQEIVQDLFISIWEKRTTLSINHFPSYLYGAIKNRVLNYIDSQSVRRKHSEQYGHFIADRENITQHDVELNELMIAIGDGIELLPEKSKRVYLLNQQGHSNTEIATMLNTSEKTIQYHLSQSMKRLRLHIKEYILISSWILTVTYGF